MEPWKPRGSQTHCPSLLSILPIPNLSSSHPLHVAPPPPISLLSPLLPPDSPLKSEPPPSYASHRSRSFPLSRLNPVAFALKSYPAPPPMRIRKRQVPLPLSSFPTLPLPDPRPINPSPMVQLPHAPSPKSSAPLLLQQPPHTPALTASSLLDYPHPLQPMEKPDDAGYSSPIVAKSGARNHHAQLDRSDEAEGGRDGEGEKRNDTGKGVSLGSGTVSEVIPLSLSNLDGKWCDGEKAIPPKKRRGRGVDYMMNTRESNNSNNNKKMKTRMKTKMNKKCTQNEDERNGGEEEGEEEEVKEEVNMDVNTSKRRGKASVVMEGSRCSRVNGRGWRCCQQTLVGYSLCEHHLGKGRLRSITSVRSRFIPSTITTAAKNNNDSLSLDGDSSVCAASSSSPEKKSKYDSTSGIHNDIDQHKDEKKPAVITKKRMKLGMVKARSISSLLGQTSNPPVTLLEDNKK